MTAFEFFMRRYVRLEKTFATPASKDNSFFLWRDIDSSEKLFPASETCIIVFVFLRFSFFGEKSLSFVCILCILFVNFT